MRSSWSPDRRRGGLTLLEVVISMTIFALALVPISQSFQSANRVTFTAQQLQDATLHAQVLLDALLELEHGELPPCPAGTETVLFDEGAGPASGGRGRFDEVVAFLAVPGPEGMARRLTARKLETGELLLTAQLMWKPPGRLVSAQRVLALAALLPPGPREPRGG